MKHFQTKDGQDWKMFLMRATIKTASKSHKQSAWRETLLDCFQVKSSLTIWV